MLNIYPTITFSELPELNPYPFYSLTPISPCGKETESLTSFLIRLSNIHCVPVGTLTSYILKELINQHFNKNPYRFPTPHLDAYCHLTSLTVKALEEYNGYKGLSYLTLSNFETVFTTRNLLRKQRAWCPQCLQYMRDNSKTIYEKLIWLFSEYDVCITHQTRIEAQCRKCGKQQEIIPHSGEIGYCQHCKNWHGLKEENDFERISYSKERIYKSQQIELMLNHFYKKHVSRDKVIMMLNRIDELSKSFMQRNELCLINLGIKNGTFKNYLKNPGKISLQILLEISWKLQISLIDLLENNDVKINIIDEVEDEEKYFTRPRSYNHDKDYHRIKELLQSILESPEIVSLSDLEGKIQISRNTIRTRFPELHEKLKEKNKLLKKKNGVKRYRIFKKNSNEIQSEINKALSTPKIIPISHIVGKLGISYPVIKRNLPDLVNKLNKKNRKIFQERYNLERENTSTDYVKFSQEYLDKVRIKLLAIKRTINNEPKFIKDILKEIGETAAIKKHFPDIFKQINEKNQSIIQKKHENILKERKLKIREAIIYLYKMGIYPSYKNIQSHIGFELSGKELISYKIDVFQEIGIEPKKFRNNKQGETLFNQEN